MLNANNKMNFNALILLLINYFGIQKSTNIVYIVDCLEKSGKEFNYSMLTLMNSIYIQKHFTENLKISKELSAHGFRTNFLSIENSSNITVIAEKIQSNNNSVGIFLNYNCNGSKDLLNSVSCAFE